VRVSSVACRISSVELYATRRQHQFSNEAATPWIVDDAVVNPVVGVALGEHRLLQGIRVRVGVAANDVPASRSSGGGSSTSTAWPRVAARQWWRSPARLILISHGTCFARTASCSCFPERAIVAMAPDAMASADLSAQDV